MVAEVGNLDACLLAGLQDRQARFDDYRRAATMIADQVSYIFLYNPSVIQAWNPALQGYQARRDGAVRFRDAHWAQDGDA